MNDKIFILINIFILRYSDNKLGVKNFLPTFSISKYS